MARTNGSDELYRLIHSLTTEEKGYFKKFALRHTSEGNKYLQLFDAISKQKEFDETKLKKEFKDLPALKNYLFNMILNALQIFETEPSVQQDIFKGIIRINLLVKKGLLASALKQVDKYRAVAEQHSMPALQLLLLKFESLIKRQTLNHQERITYLDKIAELNTKLLEEQRLNEVFLSQQYFLVAFYHLNNPCDQKQLLKKHINLKLLQTPQKKESYTEILRLSALHKYYALNGNSKKFHETGRYIMECEELLWRKNSSESNTENLLIAINNFLMTALELGEFEASAKAIALLNEIPIQNEKMRLENTIRYVHLKQIYFWAIGEHLQGYRFSDEMFKKHTSLQNFSYQQGKITSIHLVAVFFAMSVGEYKKALIWLSTFNTFPKGKLLPNTEKSVEILHILLQYEIKNFDILKSMSLSLLKRFKNLSEPEEKFVKIFATKFKNHKDLISSVGASAFSFVLEPCMNIGDWVQSKIHKVPLSKIVHQRYAGE